jgi:di/tricarboxylate transporter
MLGQMFPRREVIWLLLLFHAIWLNVARSAETTGGELDHNGTNSTDQVENVIEEEEAGYAVLFPPFTLAIGVVVFYVLSRYIKALPYTAVMFLIGILMGITSTLSDRTTALSHTLDSWISIVSGCRSQSKS